MVEELYKIKCSKYSAEELTDELRNVLYEEAKKEQAFEMYCYMNFKQRRNSLLR